ncbi:MAG: ATP-binding protein [Chitinophagaceae bacterium]|nr:MAG: ATP-binding protein [Chitinophagaceae bacterium]
MDEFKISISSKPENINKVEAFLDEMYNKFSVKEDIFGNMLISLTEAVNNSIIHGNELDDSKLVTVVCKYDGEKMVFLVSDEGEGFDYENLPDPTSPENLEKLTGRGVFLMKQLSDEVEYTNGGNTVALTFKL